MGERSDVRGADLVRELIVTGEFAAGEFLRMDPLAARLGVSVTPVREALVQLAAEGFVRALPRRGFQVLPLSDADVRDVYLVQTYVAGELAARATAGLARRDIDDLEGLQSELEQAHAAGRASEVEACNHAFHARINKAAESPRLEIMLRTTTKYAPREFFATIPGWPEASASEHREIIAALRAGDPEEARGAMAAHIQHAGRLLVEHRAVRHAAARTAM